MLFTVALHGFSSWMEPQSRQRLRRSRPPPQHAAGDPGGDDRIGALSDDMLLQVLVHLRCARTAARTGLLSRRWRGLWPRLPGLTFRDMTAAGVKSVLASVARRTAVSLLEIRLSSSLYHKLDDARAKSLLNAAVRLSPEEIIFVLPQFSVLKKGRAVTFVIPCFPRATSIELDTHFLRIVPPPLGELPMLEKLSISGHIVDVRAFLNRCPRLRMLSITFRGVEPRSLEAELATLEAVAALGLTVSRLGIESNDIDMRRSIDGAQFASLIRAAARLSPQELIFTSRFFERVDADLPCFHLTTSIEMNLNATRFTQMPAGEFSALERLALNGCTITDLVTMLIRCPRLRVLKVAADKSTRDVKVHSLSLEELELHVYPNMEWKSIHIMTPLLKQLKLNVHGKTNLRVSISAPMVEKVSWCHKYTSFPRIFGFWWLHSLRLEMIESHRHRDGVLIHDKEDICSRLPLPRVHVLSMEISSYNYLGFVLDLEPEMEKILIMEFSVFELHLNANGHVFGALVLRLLRMRPIQTNTKKLNIVLPGWSQMPQASKCVGVCRCDEPKDWRSQSISLTRLEEVEIKNFSGRDHELDFVALIFGWAPMLKTMIIRLADEVKQDEIGGWAMTIYNIFLAHPSVNCFVYLYSGEKWSGPLA
ncbi:unnamed protein product [Alopecurus aequalis]